MSVRVSQEQVFEAVTLPNACVNNAQVGTSAGIVATKLQHQYIQTYSIESGATIATGTATYMVHRVKGATGTLINVFAGQAVVPTNTITIDVMKNTLTTAISTVNLTSSATAGVAVAATTTAALVAADVIHLKIYPASTTSGLGAGFFAGVTVREDA